MFGILHPESTERDVVSFIGYGGGGNAAKEHCRRGASDFTGLPPRLFRYSARASRSAGCGDHSLVHCGRGWLIEALAIDAIRFGRERFDLESFSVVPSSSLRIPFQRPKKVPIWVRPSVGLP